MHFLDPKGVEDGRITNLYFRKFEFMEYICIIFNLLGLGLSALQYELEFEEYVSANPSDNISQWILWLIVGTTGFLIYFTVCRYQARIQWMKSRGVIGPRDKFYEIDENMYMMVEIALYCLIPLPFTSNMRITFFNINQETFAFYHVNEILTLLMSCRVVYLYRTILTLTFWSNNRTLRVCDLYSCEHNYLFVIKSLLKTAPYMTQFISLFSLLFIFGHQLRICEKPLSRNNEILDNLGLYYNSVWCIIITITFVGYGDYYPRTDLGRAVVIVVCIVGIFILSVMIVTFIESLKATPLESQTMTLLERVRLREKLEHQAAQVIQMSMQSILGWRNGTLTQKNQHSLELKLKTTFASFKMSLHQQGHFGYEYSSENLMHHVGFLRKDLHQLQQDQKQEIQSLKNTIAQQNESQTMIMDKLTQILNKLQ